MSEFTRPLSSSLPGFLDDECETKLGSSCDEYSLLGTVGTLGSSCRSVDQVVEFVLSRRKAGCWVRFGTPVARSLGSFWNAGRQVIGFVLSNHRGGDWVRLIATT
jgi:hypothetical protein